MKEKNAKFYDDVLKNEYPDLWRARQLKVKKMIRNIVIYEIFALLVAYGAYDYIMRNLALFNDRSIIWKGIVFGVILAVIPPLWFKSTYELFGKTWAGTITKVKYEMRYTQASGGVRAGRPSVAKLGNSQEYMKMRLLTDNGKRRTLAYRSHINSVLKDGDRIVKFRGFAYPAEEVEKEERYICIVCGRVVKKGTAECPRCNHSIVDVHKSTLPKDVWAQFDYAEF
jgi:DNA-directed RNA polymerase subunit RPC12/RpoP